MPTYKFTDNQRANLLTWARWLEQTDLNQGEEALKRNALEERWDETDPDKPIFLEEIPTGPPEYCCLGIYVEYRDPSRFSIECNQVNGEFPCQQKKKDRHVTNTSYLPHALAKELGLFPGPENNLQEFFVEMNDTWHMDFKQIAKEIYSLVDTGNFTEDTQERIIDACRFGAIGAK